MSCYIFKTICNNCSKSMDREELKNFISFKKNKVWAEICLSCFLGLYYRVDPVTGLIHTDVKEGIPNITEIQDLIKVLYG